MSTNTKADSRTFVLLGAAFTFMTAWFGGGWATGQLAGKYGAQFGYIGLFMPMIGAALICFVAMFITVEFARLNNVWDYANFMERFYGHKIFKIVFDVIQILTMPISFSAMIATFASTLVQYIGGTYIMWVAIFAVVVMFSVMWGTAVLNKISTAMGIGILILLVVMFGTVISTGNGANVGQMFADRTMYTSYGSAVYGGGISLYMLTGGMALSVLPCFEALQTRRDVVKTCGFSFLLVACFLFICTFNVMAFMPEAIQQEIPIMYGMQQMKANWLIPVYVVIMLLAVTSTCNAMCIGYGRRFMNFGFVTRMKASDRVKLCVISLLIIGVSSAISMLGITTIFYAGFSLVGYLNTPLVAFGLPVVGFAKLIQMKRRNFSLERGAMTLADSWRMFKSDK